MNLSKYGLNKSGVKLEVNESFVKSAVKILDSEKAIIFSDVAESVLDKDTLAEMKADKSISFVNLSDSYNGTGSLDTFAKNIKRQLEGKHESSKANKLGLGSRSIANITVETEIKGEKGEKVKAKKIVGLSR